MNLSLVPIGNSKGIRLPKAIIEKYQFQDSIEMILKEDHIILKPMTMPRKGWDHAFDKMRKAGDDNLLLPDVFEDEDFESWK
jgi:antitoxin MazE